MDRARDGWQRYQEWWNDQPRSTRITLLVWSTVQIIVFGVAIYIGPIRMFEILAGWADELRDMRLGWLYLLLTIIVTSVPPLLGYGTAQTLAGFAFGTIKGWLLGATGCVIGGCVAFLLTRRLIEYYAPMLKSNTHFVALSKAVRYKGLPLIILIRLCPFPFPYSNAFFASIESVSILQFLIATLCITPKLLLHAWVGQRMYLFASPSSRHEMDPTAKKLNALFIAIGTILGFIVSWYLYKTTMKFVDEVNEFDDDVVDQVQGEYQDLEAGGTRSELLRHVDDMLDQDDDQVDIQNLKKSTNVVYKDDEDDEITPRQSTDHWDGLSEFGDERRQSTHTINGDDEEGAWGLELDSVDEEQQDLTQVSTKHRRD
ncbi:Tlg2-vesicle protein [Microbotryomycetes sp. JL221]|nr:Tlg2-vesicle protein [Microbotryomycetes sp. JL221]